MRKSALLFAALLPTFCVVPAGGVLAQKADQPDPDTQAVAEATHEFLTALAAGEAHVLAGLGTDPFDFDGRKISGLNPIMKHWEQVLPRVGKDLQNPEGTKIDIFGYKTAELKFSKPPKKFSYLNLKRCRFAAVSFENRNGLLLIFAKDKKKKWRVAAVTD
jgi:hypothetical protein